MIEKKTYKNVSVWTGGAPERLVWNVSEEAYPQRDYDMEITFTKKVKPEVGGTATLENYVTVFTIIAVSDERVWLQDPDNQAQNFVRRFDQLRNVKPWQPA